MTSGRVQRSRRAVDTGLGGVRVKCASHARNGLRRSPTASTGRPAPRPPHSRSSGSAPRREASRRSRSCSDCCRTTPAWRSCSSSTSIRRGASFLAEALGRATRMPVIQAEDGARVEPNHVYVIPPNADVGIEGGKLCLLVAREEPMAAARTCPSISSCAPWPRSGAVAPSASSFRGRPRTGPTVCGRSRPGTASPWRRIPGRRSSAACPAARSRPGWSTTASRSPSWRRSCCA